jgi:predicted Fe-S protein YdhL (DUF1289 family)
MEARDPDPPCLHPETIVEDDQVICLGCGRRWLKDETPSRP